MRSLPHAIRRGGGNPIDGNLRDKKSEKRKGVEGRNIKGN